MNNTKILIADDEPLNLILFSQMLKSNDHNVIVANNGLEAIEVAINEQPGLIILDWNMPKLNGLEALIELKRNIQTQNIPVIMITGVMTTPGNLKLAYDNGAIDFLRKPFDKVELLARVKSILLLSSSMKELNEKYQTINQNIKFINSLINSIPHPFVYYNMDGRMQDCNVHFKKLLGVENKYHSGINVYDLCGSEIASLHKDYDRRLTDLVDENISYEGQIGQDKHSFLFSKSVYYNSAGVPAGIICIMTDVEELKKAHSEILESKKRELASSALRLIHMSEMNNRLIADLEKINEFTSSEGRDLIRATIQQFNINSGNKVWQEFETRFENVYESFYKKLDVQYPGLTPGERKLSALLRLNLSSKDIAALTFQNPQSVDMARYRLRKKMNLSQEENLIDVLVGIDG